jgi:hypothetical protein
MGDTRLDFIEFQEQLYGLKEVLFKYVKYCIGKKNQNFNKWWAEAERINSFLTQIRPPGEPTQLTENRAFELVDPSNLLSLICNPEFVREYFQPYSGSYSAELHALFQHANRYRNNCYGHNPDRKICSDVLNKCNACDFPEIRTNIEQLSTNLTQFLQKKGQL